MQLTTLSSASQRKVMIVMYGFPLSGHRSAPLYFSFRLESSYTRTAVETSPMLNETNVRFNLSAVSFYNVVKID